MTNSTLQRRTAVLGLGLPKFILVFLVVTGRTFMVGIISVIRIIYVYSLRRHKRKMWDNRKGKSVIVGLHNNQKQTI